MRESITLCIIAAWLLAPTAAPGQSTTAVGSRDVFIRYGSAVPSADTEVRVWVRRDPESPWQPASTQSAGPAARLFHAAHDGPFQFYLVLRNAAGDSGPPPAPDSQPHLSILVDTTPPVFQIKNTREPVDIDPDGSLRLSAILVEENLGAEGVRVFYRRTSVATWNDGGTASFDGNCIDWDVPASVVGALDLRIVVTDLAGNQAADELSAVMQAGATIAGPTSATADPIGQSRQIRCVVLRSIAPGVPGCVATGVAPPGSQPKSLAISAATAQSEDEQAASLPIAEFEQLRQRAKTLIERGQWSLAVTPLEAALAIAPEDAELLVDLAGVKYELRSYDEAGRRYAAALVARPDMPAALEGLALVAATDGRYPDARTHLKRLLELNPDAGRTWLRLGDIEHRLGNLSEATEAWRRAAAAPDADARIRAQSTQRLTYFAPGAQAARRP